MSIFKRILPGGNAKLITADLKRLNEIDRGMGDAAIRYVLTGEPATVLSTLSVKGGGDKLDICGRQYWRPESSDIYMKRPGVFLDGPPDDLAMMVRYAEVLAASLGTLPDRIPGSDKTPAPMRILFGEAFVGSVEQNNRWPRQKRTAPIKGLTTDRLLPTVQALGGTPSDLFELLFWQGGPYDPISAEHFRELTDMTALVQALPEQAIEGALCCAAAGREAFIKSLASWGLIAKEPFMSFAFKQAGDGSKAVREAAVKALRALPADVVEPLAVEHLSKGTVAVRASMVELLLSAGTESAADALRAHAKTEKTARITATIENALAAGEVVSKTGSDADDAAQYTAIDGTKVDIPAVRPIATGDAIAACREEQKMLQDLVAAENRAIEAWNRENKGRKYFWKRPLFKAGFAEDLVRLLQGETISGQARHQAVHFLNNQAQQIAKDVLARMPQDQALKVTFLSMHSPTRWLSPHFGGCLAQAALDYLASPDADLRAVEDLWRGMGFQVTLGGWRNRETRPTRKGDLLRCLIPADSYMGTDPEDLPRDALWPYLAENLDVLDEAFGLGAVGDAPLDRVRAVAFLKALPKVPARHFAPLLEMATGERKAGKAEARRLLADVPEVSERLAALLGDSRQAVRAGAAEWMGDRGDASAVKPLKARLKKEKSELAKAAILTALQKLGEPLDDFVGPAALIAEAAAGLKKAKFDKLDWMKFEALPAPKFKNDKPVPLDLVRWWVYLGFKLKQPGGNALFDIYLDQLAPESAEAVSHWVLDSWLAFDTAVPSDEEANAHAEKNADQRYHAWKRYYPDYTREMAFASLRAEMKSNYFNSGAASKGILALAVRTPPQIAADRVRAYLRNHGKRTSQASSLLDMLAGMGDPVSLQVVIAAATRLKQKGVQAHAGELVQAVADRMNWSMDELGDRVIPSAGLDDDCALELPCGPDERVYHATLGEDLAFVLENPDGRVVKSLPTGSDDATKAAKKQLSASKKELKQVVSMQTGRLYEALCSGRVWDIADWTRDFRDHPVMRRLTERVVWQGLDAEGKAQASFRPTAEVEYTNADDGEIDPARFAWVRIAHGATMDEADADRWQAHLKDYEVKPLFPQFGRTLMRLAQSQGDETLIEDRKGWVLETFQLRGIATKLGYERGQAEDGGWFYEYRKPFRGAGLTAVVSFTGNALPEENRSAALVSLAFEKAGKRIGRTVKLAEVPEVLLSECWNDLHAMAAKAAFDPDWEKTCQW